METGSNELYGSLRTAGLPCTFRLISPKKSALSLPKRLCRVDADFFQLLGR